jgi:hypothetical protein
MGAVAIMMIVASSLIAAAQPPAPVAPPSPPPPPPVAPTSRPSPEQLHAQAYEFMLAGQSQRAQAPLEQAYKARPLRQQPRSLILNRAILDIAQRINIMRPVKDLREYLANLPPEQVDEDAVDLLGAALQAARKSPRTAELPLTRTGEKQLALSIELLEQSRPRERKWGQKWYTENDFREIRARVEHALAIYKYEQEQADRLLAVLASARAEANRFNVLNTNLGHQHRTVSEMNACSTCRGLRNQSRDATDARDALARADADYQVQKLRAEQAKQGVPQPDWTAVPFRPFHPAGVALPVAAAPPPQPAEPIASPQPPIAADLFGDPEPAPPSPTAPSAPYPPAPPATQPLFR